MKKIINVKTRKDIFTQYLSSNNVPFVILARDIDGLHDVELRILTEVFFLAECFVEPILISETS